MGGISGWLDDFRVYDTYLDASEVAGFINSVVNVQPLISSPLQYPANTPRRLIYNFVWAQRCSQSVTGFTESDLLL